MPRLNLATAFLTSPVLTVKMSDYTDKHIFRAKVLDKSLQLNASKRTEFFTDKNTGFDSSFSSVTTNPSTFSEMLLRQSTVNSQVNQLFKVPNLDNVPVKGTSVKSIRSSRIGVQAGKLKNDLKPGEQPKMSLIPRPSFINSRKSLHGSRCTQLNARKELIKKMVFLAECTLKENKQNKQSTPVKTLAGLTPKKTPRSGGYFILPEFKKKVAKLEDIRSPIEDFIKKEMFSYSAKPTPLPVKMNASSPIKPKEKNSSDFIAKPKEDVNKSPGNRFAAILRQCKEYNTQVSLIHEGLKILDESFESKLENLPDYKVYNEFIFYQSKKEDLYKELQTLERDLRNFVSTHTNVGCKLKAYARKKQEFFEKQVNLHREFEKAVEAALEKCGRNEREEETLAEGKPKAETPRLRRSLRLSKMKKNKFEERTPMSRKLKKLDSKSKGIQKSGKVRSPERRRAFVKL